MCVADTTAAEPARLGALFVNNCRLRLVGNKWEGLTILSSADGFDARDGRVQHNVLTDICSLSRRGCPSSMPGSLHVNELLKATAADVRAACE